MRNILIALLSAASYLLIGTTSAEVDEGKICTLEYAPICAKIQVQCFRAPCYPIYKTFGNQCEMSRDSLATESHAGACTAFEEGNPAIISEGLKSSIRRQYDDFLFRISSLEAKNRLSKLETVNNRVSDKLALLVPNISLGIVQEMANDRLRQIYSYLKDINDMQISKLQEELTGKRYLFRDPVQCETVRYICQEGLPFSDSIGCGCQK